LLVVGFASIWTPTYSNTMLQLKPARAQLLGMPWHVACFLGSNLKVFYPLGILYYFPKS